MSKFIDYTGKKIGRLTFISFRKGEVKTIWNVRCDCGVEKEYRSDFVSRLSKKGKVFECQECQRLRRSKVLLDKTYGRLEVIKHDKENPRKGCWYICKCACGKTVSVLGKSLTSPTKPTRSCGCYMRKIHSRNSNTTQYPPSHGFKKNRNVLNKTLKYNIYNIKTSLAAACYNPRSHRYKHTGAIGYTLCDTWRNSSKDFYEWMVQNGYEKGKGLYIKQGEKEYNPSNCYVSWKGEEAAKIHSKLISFNGKIQGISDWARELGMKVSTLSKRLSEYVEVYGIERVMNPSIICPKRKYKTDYLEEKIVELYKDGKTYKEIRDLLDCQSSTIKRFLVKNNVPIRPQAHLVKKE